MNSILSDLRAEFRRQKATIDRALAQLGDEQFFHRPGESVNPVALIVKHIAGNLASRWSDFLTTDGEKPSRDRDAEFILRDGDTRPKLMEAWENGWAVLLSTLDGLKDSDLAATVQIRGESLSAQVAILRGLSHVAYHVGQITYLRRMLQPGAAWLTIAPGQSRQHVASYTRPA